MAAVGKQKVFCAVGSGDYLPCTVAPEERRTLGTTARTCRQCSNRTLLCVTSDGFQGASLMPWLSASPTRRLASSGKRSRAETSLSAALRTAAT